MKFQHPKDTKVIILGIIASLTAVVLWDIIKDRKQIFNFRSEND